MIIKTESRTLSYRLFALLKDEANIPTVSSEARCFLFNNRLKTNSLGTKKFKENSQKTWRDFTKWVNCSLNWTGAWVSRQTFQERRNAPSLPDHSKNKSGLQVITRNIYKLSDLPSLRTGTELAGTILNRPVKQTQEWSKKHSLRDHCKTWPIVSQDITKEYFRTSRNYFYNIWDLPLARAGTKTGWWNLAQSSREWSKMSSLRDHCKTWPIVSQDITRNILGLGEIIFDKIWDLPSFQTGT